jgi:NADPH:quinone reductase-like Zn-dependent oxidoreductase
VNFRSVPQEYANEEIRGITAGRMANVVLNSLGAGTWPLVLEVLGSDGRFVFFGTITGAKVDLDLFPIYDKQVRIIGTTGDSRNEMQKMTDKARALKVRVWREFRLEETANALRSLSSKEGDGRILIEPYQEIRTWACEKAYMLLHQI